MISVRCSALPRIMKCGRSAELDGLLVDEWNDAAPLGTAVHDVLRPIVEGRSSAPSDDEIEAAALRWDVNKKELSILAWAGFKIWQEIGPSFGTDPRTEVEYGGFFFATRRLTGHVDVDAVVPADINDAGAGMELRQLDWKSGRVDRGYGHQVRGYMALGLLEHKECVRATHLVAWLRDQEVEPYRMTRPQMLAFFSDLDAALAKTEHVVGNHCSFCPKRATCEARLAMGRADVAIMGGEPLDVSQLAPEQLGKLWDAWDRASRVGASFEKAVRALVEERGAVSLGDRTLTLTPVEKREVDTAKAWPVVEARVPDMAEVVEIKLTAARDAVKAKAGKGQGAKAIRELDEALAAAGAVRMSSYQKLTERRDP